MRYAQRLIIAFIISLTCFASTIYWYRSTAPKKRARVQKNAIATLVGFDNIVQRKPVSQVIWEGITKDDELFSGESIRTASSSEARIQFLKSGTVIELEPNSLIVLEESEGEVALNFLKGNIFLNQEASSSNATAALTIKTGQNEIKVSKAQLSLSKAKENADVNLEVFGGQAQLTQKDGQTLELDKSKSGTLTQKGLDVSQQKLEVLSPLPGDPVYFDPVKGETLPVTWNKLPPGYVVTFHSGTRRSKLTRQPNLSANGEKGQMQVQPKAGKFFWRIIAESTNKNLPLLKSPIFPIKMIAKLAPTPILPKDQDQLVLDNDLNKVKFKWANKSRLENLYLQVAKDKALKNIVLEQALPSKRNSMDLELKEKGLYYWRITGYMNINGKSEALASSLQNFQLGFKQVLTPPKLKSPINGYNLSYVKSQKSGVTFTWEPVPGIEKYKLKLITPDKKELFYDSLQSVYNLKDLPFGTYSWSVASVSHNNQLSAYSKDRQFQVKSLPKIEITSEKIYQYYTAQPELNFEWTTSTNKVNKWRYKLKPKAQKEFDSKWVITSQPSTKVPLKSDGLYEVIIEGITESNKIGARSDLTTLEVKARPLLPAPIYPAHLPPVLKSSASGTIKVVWQPVEGAQMYKVQLKQANGELLSEQNASSNETQFNRLHPGDYKVSVQAIDNHQRPGPYSLEKRVEVPSVSNIKAPTLKGIQIK